MSLSRTERIDKFGFCCYCGENLLTKRVVDGKVVDMFTPQYDQTTFLLDTGSQMQITLCKKCKGSIELNDAQVHADIMESVNRGWELEVKTLVADESKPEWTEEKGKEYLDKMGELSIYCNSENMSHHQVQSKAVELMGLKVEEVKADLELLPKEEVSLGTN